MKLNQLITTVLILSHITPIPSSHSASLKAGNEKVKDALKQYKESLLVLGSTEETAIRELGEAFARDQISIVDIQTFFAKYASSDEQNIYEQVLTSGLNQNEFALSELTKTLINQSTEQGANFKVSCGLTLGASIPILVAGIVVGAVYLKNISQDQKVETNYASNLSKAYAEYISSKSGIENSLLSQIQDIATRQNQIAFINQQIDSGVYSAQEREAMRQQIAQLQIETVSIQNSTSALNAQITELEDNYTQKLIVLSRDRSGALLDWTNAQQTRKSQAIVGIALGSTLITASVAFACETRKH